MSKTVQHSSERYASVKPFFIEMFHIVDKAISSNLESVPVSKYRLLSTSQNARVLNFRVRKIETKCDISLLQEHKEQYINRADF